MTLAAGWPLTSNSVHIIVFYIQIFDILKFANGFLSIRTFEEGHKSAYYRQTNGGHEEMLINENGINLHM